MDLVFVVKGGVCDGNFHVLGEIPVDSSPNGVGRSKVTFILQLVSKTLDNRSV